LRAITISPALPNSLRLDDVPEPPAADGALLVESLTLGVCGTDREIIAGEYGAAPDGQDRLILGHESLGRVLQAPDQCDLAVNANLRHYQVAADSLTGADRAWLGRLITRRVPLTRFAEAFDHRKGDIKVMIEFA
jgi:threonine dehydrogenase-like Zn-dependent dehydrogenase